MSNITHSSKTVKASHLLTSRKLDTSGFRSCQNVLTNNPLSQVVINRETYQSLQQPFNITVTPQVKATDQKSSGRCWIFAGLNMIRRPTIDLYSLKEFEFSQAYIFFWDKLEKMNYALESIIETKHKDLDSRLVNFLLKDPIADGGTWPMFCNLVEKYGLVPKSIYRESYHSSNSGGMTDILKRKFREYALLLRDSTTPEKLKATFMVEVFELLCKFLGTPPTVFNWMYTDDKKKVRVLKNLTPQEFYHEKVPFKCSDYTCLTNDPRNSYNKIYSVKYLGNVLECGRARYLNLPIEKLKMYTLRALKQNRSVWFGCDVGKCFNNKESAMDVDLIDYKDFLDIEFDLSKSERLDTCESLNTHAMLFSGARTEFVQDTQTDETVCWQVENSWSAKGDQKGFYSMSDKWFSEYLYQVVVPITYLTRPEQRILLKTQPVMLEPWDPLGALAKTGN